MTKTDALNIIQTRISTEINPVELLHWCWLNAIVMQILPSEWEMAVERATVELSK